jgi:hypothetical protein
LVDPDGGAGGVVVHEALQESINRYALPLRFLPDSRFGLCRDVEAHAKSSLPGITLLSYAPLAALSRLPRRRAADRKGGGPRYGLGLSHTSTRSASLAPCGLVKIGGEEGTGFVQKHRINAHDETTAPVVLTRQVPADYLVNARQ